MLKASYKIEGTIVLKKDRKYLDKKMDIVYFKYRKRFL